ncbi:MAG: hypothetical protein ACODAJ_05570 [Planctomycetota bacterium]
MTLHCPHCRKTYETDGWMVRHLRSDHGYDQSQAEALVDSGELADPGERVPEPSAPEPVRPEPVASGDSADQEGVAHAMRDFLEGVTADMREQLDVSRALLDAFADHVEAVKPLRLEYLKLKRRCLDLQARIDELREEAEAA